MQINVINRTWANKLSLAWLLLGAALLIMSLTPVISGDGEIRFHDVIRLYRLDDIPKTQFSVIQPLLSVPLYWLGTFFATPEIIVSWLNCLVFIIFLFCLCRLLPNTNLRFFTIALLLCTTMFPHHLNRYDGEMITAVAVSLGFFYLLENRIALGASLLTIGVAQTPASLPAFALAVCFVAYRAKRPKWLLLIALPLLFIMLETFFKHGSLLNNPYLTGNQGVKTIMPYSGLPGFSYPFFLGLVSILFSFGKGLIFFIPALFLRLIYDFKNDANQKVVLLIDVLLIFVLGMILTYSKWWAWYGGGSWGPRFFLIGCIPASLLLAIGASKKDGRVKSTLIYLMALVLSAWVCLQGFIYGNQNLEICPQNNYAYEFMCWYVPEFSPLFRQFLTTFETEISPQKYLFVVWVVTTVFVCIFYKLYPFFRKLTCKFNPPQPLN